jgi:hypothetical protein
VGWRFLVGIYVITALMGEIRSLSRGIHVGNRLDLMVPSNLPHNVPAAIEAAINRLSDLTIAHQADVP